MEANKYFKLLKDLYPLHRTLVSDGTDQTLEIIVDFLKKLGLSSNEYMFHEFPSGTELSTWIVPKKYTLKNYYLGEMNGGKEKVIIDKEDIPLSVAEYSQPVDGIYNWEEINKHLFYADRRPQDIPYIFKFLYRKNFGFCLPKVKYDQLNRKAKYRAVIKSEFEDGSLKCLEVVIPGKKEDSLLMISNICHSYQANDSITGVINNLIQIEHFLKKKPNFTMRFGFWPETIGAQGYFSKYYKKKNIFKYAIFTEMLGTSGKHALQFSKQGNTYIDRIALYALKNMGLDYYSGRYLTLLRNDERVSNGANLNIPTISLSRWPYSEYHTSADNPSIIDMNRVEESSQLIRRIIEILDSNKTMKPTFFGQPFLTRYGLFYDHTENDDAKKLNKIQEDIFSYLDGEVSLFDIAERFNYGWEVVLQQAECLKNHKLFIGE